MSILPAAIICCIGLYACILSFSNYRYLKRLQQTERLDTSQELVSVLIPARNEEHTIAACVRSILAQSHTNMEILILDDDSSDGTEQIVKELAESDARVHLIKGKKLKEGWRGKIYAMQQLYENSMGTYVLFTDADTIHRTDSISYGLSLLITHQASMLSGYPKQITRNLPLELLVSAMLFNPTLFVPFKLQERLQLPLFAMAIGQYLFLKRSALDHIQGFSHIKHEICDDVQLARSCTRMREKMLFAPMGEALSCEMFPTFKEAFHGLERSILGVVKQGWIGTILILFIVLILLLLSLSPLLTIYYAYTAGMPACMLSLTGNVLFLLAWGCSAHLFKFSFRSALASHLTVFLVTMMYLHGLLLVLSGKGFEWKGRKIV